MTGAQNTLRSNLRGLLALPDTIGAAKAQKQDIQTQADFLHTELLLDGMAATYLHPKGPGPFPAILYCHAHGGQYDLGRKELTRGAPWLARIPAPDLLAAGFAVLSIDMPGFGDRQNLGSEGALAKAGLWQGQPLFGRMIEDLSKALGWLCAQPKVDATMITTMGVSMGAAHAYWLAALDPRVSATAHMCVLADVAGLIEVGAHDRHGHYLTVPGLLPIADAGDIAGLIAPRPQFIGHGETDGLTPPAARDTALGKLRAAYGQSTGLETYIEPNGGHKETPQMRQAVLDFLSRNSTNQPQEMKIS